MNNIVNEYINFSKHNIIKYGEMILENLFIKDIFLVLLDSYISANFYNYYDNLSGTDDISIKKYLQNKKEEIAENTLFYKEEINNNYQAFMYAIDLNNLSEVIDNDNLFSQIVNFQSKINSANINELKLFVKDNIIKKDNFLHQFDTDDFYLSFKKTNITHLYNVKLEYNIKFSELYSEVAIDKAFNRDLIIEQKMFVSYYLLSAEILKNVINKKIQKVYLIDFDLTLFEKEKKIKRLLKIVDNDLLKEKIIFKITYKNYLSSTEYIAKMLKLGYKFAVELDDSFNNNEANLILLNSFEFIIINNDKYYFKELNKITNIVDFR